MCCVVADRIAADSEDVDKRQGVDYQAFKESQYELLADSLRKHLDMEKIYQILEQGV